MRQPVHIAVLNARFCIAINCPSYTNALLGGTQEFVDCACGGCDNHKRGAAPVPAPVSNTPPFALPEPGSTRPLE